MPTHKISYRGESFLVGREFSFLAYHSHHGMITEPSHSHRYRVRLTMKLPVNEEGFTFDFRVMKRLFYRVIQVEIENKNLDELFEFPTSETLSLWIWQKMSLFLPLYSLEIWEKPTAKTMYFGPSGHSVSAPGKDPV